MNKEIISIEKNTTKLKIVNNKIESILKSSDIKTGLRLYDNGIIGIAGAIGSFDEKKLEKKAKDMLAFKIPYNVEITKDTNKKMDFSKELKITDKQLTDITGQLLAELETNYPDFSFSHIVSTEEFTQTLKNDANTNLAYSDKLAHLTLTFKHKKSINAMDGGVFNVSRNFTLKDAYEAFTPTLDAYNNKVDIKSGEVLPVIFTNDFYTTAFLWNHLNGRMVALKASTFANRIGEKVFADDFSLIVNKDSKNTFNSFFDGEGSTLKDDKFYLIENGIIKAPYASKKIAKDFGFTNSASADFTYDGVPAMTPNGISVKAGTKTLQQLLGNQKAILVEMASGGDFTSQGEYSTPVQCAYLWENGKILGRLPQIAVSSDIYKLCGIDFIGKSSDGQYANSPLGKYIVSRMKVTRLGGWQ